MIDLLTTPIRIFILDSQALVRAGLRLIIENRRGMIIIGDSGDISEGLEIVACQKPDIILLNFDNLDDLSLDVISRYVRAGNHPRIILITNSTNSQMWVRAIKEGVLGIILKTQPPEVLIKAIEKVHCGEVWIERSMIARVFASLSDANQRAEMDPEMEKISQLSDRELQVIRLIGLGLKNQQIASRLCLSQTTVRHHLTSIFRKLGVTDRLELLVFANRCGLTKKIEKSYFFEDISSQLKLK